MSIDTPTAAREAVYTDIASLHGGGVTVQELGKIPVPKPIGILLTPAGMSDSDFLVRISVYVDASSDVEKSILDVEDYSYRVDDLLGSAPRSDWTTTFDLVNQAWHAQTVVRVGREDF